LYRFDTDRLPNLSLSSDTQTLMLTQALLFASLLSTPPPPLPLPSLCGIELSPKALQLLQDVEHKLAHPVQCQTSPDLSIKKGASAHSEVAPDGVGVITLDIFRGKTESNIVHELFHLQLRTQGFSQKPRFDALPNTDDNQLTMTVMRMGDLIEHRIFYPKMRRMGFDPTADYRKEVESALSSGTYGVQLPETMSVNYAMVRLLINDPKLTQRVETFYVHQGLIQALTRGKKLVSYLLTSNPDTAPKKRKAVSDGLQIVFARNLNVKWDD
jgi:hypothetical protein